MLKDFKIEVPMSKSVYILPKGEYLPAYQDSHGIFYAAPDGIVHIKGKEEKKVPGGIHMPKRLGQYYSVLSMYVISSKGKARKLPMPGEFKKGYGKIGVFTRDGKPVGP
jgi:hypothetical protein